MISAFATKTKRQACWFFHNENLFFYADPGFSKGFFNGLNEKVMTNFN
jgi:hypothetical protein